MNSIPLTADTTEQQITQNVIDTLKAAMADGKPVFDRVIECETIEAMFQYGQPNQSICGVQVLRSDRTWGESNMDQFAGRLPLNIGVGNYYTDPINGDVTPAVKVAQRLLDLARSALMVDPWRGGLATALMWDGKLVKGTDINGKPSIVKRTAKQNPAFFAMVLPVQITYAKAQD